MTIDAYTTSGENRLPPYLIEAPRDPINGVDFVSPNGDFYNRQYEWFNTIAKTFWFYQGQGIWIQMTGGSAGPLIQFTGDTGTTGFPVNPDGTGHIEFTSNNQTLAITGSLNSINFDLSGGNKALDEIKVDAFTPPGTDPVLADNATGRITITGNQVSAIPGIGNRVIRTNSLAINSFEIQIQRSSTSALSDLSKNGVSHFKAGQFNVDTDGLVELVGGPAPATQNFNVDTFTAPGTQPVEASATGLINLHGGATYATGTRNEPIRTDSLAANSINLEIQLAGNSTLPNTPETNKFGVSQYNQKSFLVTDGYVDLQFENKAFTFLPELAFNGDITGITYSSQIGRYYEVGNLVFFSIALVLTNKGPGPGPSIATILNMPFPAAAFGGTTNFMNGGNLFYDAGYSSIFATIEGGTNILKLIQQGSGVPTIVVAYGNFINSTAIVVNGWYGK